MTPEKDRHLSDAQMLHAIINESDQDISVAQHFASCASCRAERARLTEKLEQLGRNAQQYAPAPRKQILLADLEDRDRSDRFWSRHRILALGFAACLIIVSFYAARVLNTDPKFMVSNAPVEMSSDEELINQVCALGENALPSWQRALSGESADEQDDDFMGFLIPQVEADLSSLGEEAVRPC